MTEKLDLMRAESCNKFDLESGFQVNSGAEICCIKVHEYAWIFQIFWGLLATLAFCNEFIKARKEQETCYTGIIWWFIFINCSNLPSKVWKIHFKSWCLPAACIPPSSPAHHDQGTQAASPTQWCDPARFSEFPRCISEAWSSRIHWAPKGHNCKTELRDLWIRRVGFCACLSSY